MMWLDNSVRLLAPLCSTVTLPEGKYFVVEKQSFCTVCMCFSTKPWEWYINQTTDRQL